MNEENKNENPDKNQNVKEEIATISQNVDEIMEEMNYLLVNNDLTVRINEPSFDPIRNAYPKEWHELINLYVGEINKYKHFYCKIHNKLVEVRNREDELLDQIDNLYKDKYSDQEPDSVIDVKGVKVQVKDLLKLIYIFLAVSAVVIFIIIMLAKYDVQTFDKIVTVIEKFVTKDDNVKENLNNGVYDKNKTSNQDVTNTQ